MRTAARILSRPLLDIVTLPVPIRVGTMHTDSPAARNPKPTTGFKRRRDMATTRDQSESKRTCIVRSSVIDPQMVEASESRLGGSSPGESQPKSAQSDPVTEFKKWLANATEQELEEAEHRCGENVLGCYRN